MQKTASSDKQNEGTHMWSFFQMGSYNYCVGYSRAQNYGTRTSNSWVLRLNYFSNGEWDDFHDNYFSFETRGHFSLEFYRRSTT